MIAIVAQNHTLLTLYRMLLTEHGFQTNTFLENDAAIESLVASCPSLIITSYFSGFIDEELPFVTHLHAIPSLTHVPVLFCASHEVWPDDAHKVSGMPWLTLIDQPFQGENLLEAVRAAMPSK